MRRKNVFLRIRDKSMGAVANYNNYNNYRLKMDTQSWTFKVYYIYIFKYIYIIEYHKKLFKKEE